MMFQTALLKLYILRNFANVEYKKDNIKVCKDCELRYNCIDCRAGHQVDNGSKPVGCNYDPYKLIWNDEHK